MRFLKTITPDNMADHTKQMQRFNVGEDSPVFDGLYQFCQASSGGSIGGAVKLNKGAADVAINWAGGLHHAKKCEASGFCYANDIVLAILEVCPTAACLPAAQPRPASGSSSQRLHRHQHAHPVHLHLRQARLTGCWSAGDAPACARRAGEPAASLACCETR